MRIERACRHIRYNFEPSPREDQSVSSNRVYFIFVDNESTSKLASDCYNELSKYGMLDNTHTEGVVRGIVINSDFKWEFASYDIAFKTSKVEEALKRLNYLCVRDERLVELRKRYKKNQFRNEQTTRNLTDRIRAYYEFGSHDMR